MTTKLTCWLCALGAAATASLACFGPTLTSATLASASTLALVATGIWHV